MPGKTGEFTVWVGDRRVAGKGWFRFPKDRAIVSAVDQALRSHAPGILTR